MITLSLTALLALTSCQTLPTSNRAVQPAPTTSLVAEGNRTNTDERQQPAILSQLKLYPIDEGEQDRSFAEFRDKLIKATRDHDTAFVISVLHPEIINNSDGDGGVKEFQRQWKLDQPDSRLWETLATVLSMGGSFRLNDGHHQFCAPYVTSQWPTVVSQLPKSADPLDYQVITAKDVTLRSAPDPAAPLVTTLSYDVVKVLAESTSNTPAWLKITTLSGKVGYVFDKYIRSASDYQACFEKVGDKWMMTELAARE